VHRPGHVQPGLKIDAHGLRSTGAPPAGAPSGPILAVGDSYTFGEDVADEETWPAQLQRLTGRRVLNGGVAGYGFDQVVLRAESLAAIHRPSAILVGAIAADIERTEMRRLWRKDKPWFAVVDGQLELRGVPVPRVVPSAAQRLLWRHPLLEQAIRLLPLEWTGRHVRVAPAGSGEAIACRLTGRLAGLQRTSGARVVVLAMYDPVAWDHPAYAGEQRRMMRALLDCAAGNGLATLDSFGALSAAPRPRQLYLGAHFNAAGNLVIARCVAAALSRPGIAA
jgi:lysophospholipase L1-like esterase